MKRILSHIKKKNLGMMVSLSLVLVLVSAVALFAAPNPGAPSVSIRHEVVTNYNGNQIHRMIVSARAPAGFSLFGVVISYDNRVIVPVNSDSHADIAAPYNTAIQSVTGEPFSVLASGFTETPDAWLVRGYRTGFSFDVFSMGAGVNSDALTDVFAFYYRIEGVGGSGSGDFRIEDGRYAGSMVGTETNVSFVRPGVQMQSGGTTYIWGPNTAAHEHTEIYDVNIILTGGQAPEPVPTPEPTPEPPESTPEPGATPVPTAEPGASPNPTTAPGASPNPTAAPGASPSPSPAPGSSPSPSPASNPPSDARPNPATNPLNISFSIFGAVVMLGLAVTGILGLTKKHKVETGQYDTDIARHNREKRITDKFDSQDKQA